jgi:hypothetical protein
MVAFDRQTDAELVAEGTESQAEITAVTEPGGPETLSWLGDLESPQVPRSGTGRAPARQSQSR